MFNLKMILILLAISSFVIKVLSYSSGAPSSACSTMIPGHGGSAQNSASVIRVSTVKENCYTAESPLNLQISGNSFRGFMVEERIVVGNEKPVGSFQLQDTLASMLNCNNVIASAVTHSNGNLKSNVKFSWNVPANPPPQITFRLTVVQDFLTYWVSVDTTINICQITAATTAATNITTANTATTTTTKASAASTSITSTNKTIASTISITNTTSASPTTKTTTISITENQSNATMKVTSMTTTRTSLTTNITTFTKITNFSSPTTKESLRITNSSTAATNITTSTRVTNNSTSTAKVSTYKEISIAIYTRNLATLNSNSTILLYITFIFLIMSKILNLNFQKLSY